MLRSARSLGMRISCGTGLSGLACSRSKELHRHGPSLLWRCFSSNSPSSLNDYWSSLRWKAASALTSALAEQERNQLLAHFEPKWKDKQTSNAEEENTVPTQSIDEAVAQARRQEALKHEQLLDKERERLQREAEEAARKRVESDIATQRRQLAFQQWKKQLEQDQSSSQPDTAETHVNGASQTHSTDHPVLGPKLHNLGHKRIHLAQAAALSTIPVWKKQRVYRHARVKTMADDKRKTLHLGLPGIIGIYESLDGSLSILDGQHRVGMLKELNEKIASSKGGFNSLNFDFDKVLVEVYPAPKAENGERTQEDVEEMHAKEIFLEVNKAEPVKLVDLPGVAKASHRNMINKAASVLHLKYEEMFRPSQRCLAPHLNIDNLRDALFASNVIQRHSLSTPKALEEWMLAQNDALAAKYELDSNRETVSERAFKKAKKHSFYLGLESSWLYN